MKILKNDIIDPGNFVTGTVLALKGRINSNGFFETSDYTYPGVPSIPSMPDQYKNLVTIEESKEVKPLFEDLESREFVVFTSGIEFGNPTEKATTELFTRWMLGQYGTADERLLSSRVSRVVVGGNTIGEESDIDEVMKGSYRTHEINERVYCNLSSAIEQFESFVTKLTQNCDVDVMPGENDVSGSFMPQQPLNVALFPKLLSSSLKHNSLIFSTNPHKFSLNGLKFLGSSGQNIEDICRFRDMSSKSELDILYETLQLRHIAPTCPDTLRSYPFENEDPLIIRDAPNVYFSCNAKEYSSMLETQLNGLMRIFTVPSFTKTKEVVLLDLGSLDTYSYKIQIDESAD